MAAIRALTPLDAPWLAAFHGQAFATPWSARSFADLLALPAVDGWALDGPGFILTQAAQDQGEILTFQVAAAAQGQGRGGALLTYAIAHLRSRGVRTLTLEVAVDRLAARKLYENQGFKLRGQRKNYYKTAQGRQDAQIWALHILDI